MKSFIQFILGCSLLLIFQSNAAAQQTSNFDAHEAFDQTLFDRPGTVYRSGRGTPGPQYWQNEADYTIRVTLDTAANRIEGTDVITYTNNSPDQLHTLWLQLDQNMFAEDGKAYDVHRSTRPANNFEDYGFDLSNVKLRRGGQTTSADYEIKGTRMQIRLKEPLEANGGTIEITMNFGYTISHQFIRTGRMNTENGFFFDISQWYPRMCVYDDIRGWNTLPFLISGEFYTEFGDYDYYITAPSNMVVLGSGNLQNPGDVLTDQQQKRLDKARKSDETIHIIKPSEVGARSTRPQHKNKLTWHYSMQNTRDVAWAASNALVWDAVRFKASDNRSGLAMAGYPKSIGGDTAWGKAAQFVKGSVEIFSNQWYEYPWESATVVPQPGGGMEFPGMVFVGKDFNTRTLWRVVAHEYAHNWFPMLVGSQERRYPWMDEGIVTYISATATLQYKNGKYMPYGGWQAQPRHLTDKFSDPQMGAVMTRPDVSNDVGFTAYRKPGLGFYLLRNYVVGAESFDYALRRYTEQWAFKHPSPLDFFRTINNQTGENLNWFWKGWFYETWTIDQAVSDVHYVDANPEEGSLITLRNLDKMPMPVKLKVFESNGRTHRRKLPVEIWQDGPTHKVRINTKSRLDSVIIDPEKWLPDINPENNLWKR